MNARSGQALLPGLMTDLKRFMTQRGIALLSAHVAMIAASGGDWGLRPVGSGARGRRPKRPATRLGRLRHGPARHAYHAAEPLRARTRVWVSGPTGRATRIGT
jgi:hypothetical protein